MSDTFWDIRLQLGNWVAKVPVSKEQFASAKDAHRAVMEIIYKYVDEDGIVDTDQLDPLDWGEQLP